MGYVTANRPDIRVRRHDFLHFIRRVEVGIEAHGVELHDLLSGGIKELPVTFGGAAVSDQNAHVSADALYEVGHPA
jgi:hypothetical protein